MKYAAKQTGRAEMSPAQIDRARCRRSWGHLGAGAGRGRQALRQHRAQRNWLVIGMSRLDWEQAILGNHEPRRLVAGLRFERAFACMARKIDRIQPAALDLLASSSVLSWRSAAGLLLFAHGGVLRPGFERF